MHHQLVVKIGSQETSFCLPDHFQVGWQIFNFSYKTDYVVADIDAPVAILPETGETVIGSWKSVRKCLNLLKWLWPHFVRHRLQQ